MSRARGLCCAAAVLVAAGAAGCVAAPERAAEVRLDEARVAFAHGDYEVALGLFREVREDGVAPLAAELGIARSHQIMGQYAAALTAYEEVLDQRPDNALAWRGYVATLHQDGMARGDGGRLATVLEVAPDALGVAPHSVDSYTWVLQTAAALGRLEEYAQILAEVAAQLPDDAVVHAKLLEARLTAARRARNAAQAAQADGDGAEGEVAAAQATVDRIEGQLRGWIDEIATGARSSNTAPDALYALALGNDLLRRSGQVDESLQQLERSEEGREMAAPLRYQEFLGEWVRSVNADSEERIALAERWLQRFEPRWSNDGMRYRAVLGMQFEVMLSAARAALAAPGGALDEQRAERIAQVGRRLARIDTGNGAARYVDTAGILALVPTHYVTAVRVTDDGIEALRADRYGLFHTGTPEAERERLRSRYLALLLQLQAQALHNLERDDEAEDALRRAVGLYPAAPSYAMLGGLLLDAGRPDEALDMLVEALAHGFEVGDEALAEQTRASASEAAARRGSSTARLDASVAAAAERVAVERDRAIVANPLDTRAPDFVLADLDGRQWRLDELAGNVVVLNFWATWCAPCIAEMPYYQSLVDEYRDAADVVLLAVSTDADVARVVAFLEQGDYDFPVSHAPAVADAFDVTGVPAGFIIGKDGLIRYRSSGFPGPERYLREMRLRIEALR
ncbi:MAG: redoxin domain-containing protein [Acidobacteriota bacterium]